MLDNMGKALVITRREVIDQFRDWRIILPVLGLTVFFPALMNFTATQAVSFVERYGAPEIGDRLIPFLLMIVGFFPISISLVIALESFVGEKERRSIEPLLSSPLTDSQLYLGKLLAAMVPPLLASYIGIAVYLVSINIQIGWKPDPILLIQILLLTTIQAIVMVSGAVVVSSQTTSVRAANLLASFIIIPMAMLVQGESLVMFWANYSALWWAIVGLLVIAILLVRTGLAYFNREELLSREMDTINLRWGWQIFSSAFVGRAKSVRQWYREEILQALREMILPAGFMTVILGIGIWAGISQAGVFPLPMEKINFNNLSQSLVSNLASLDFVSTTGVGIVWFHNLRATTLATLLGIFSFGVVGVLVLMIPLTLIAYLAANITAAGFSPLVFLTALVLPHGVLEIPAIILTGAAILSLGATLATPASGKTIGEAWLQALARWTKLMLGVAAPLFLLAALVEVLVTPLVAIAILGK